MIKWVAHWMALSAALAVSVAITLCGIDVVIGIFTMKYHCDIEYMARIAGGLELVFLLYAVGLALFLRLYNE